MASVIKICNMALSECGAESTIESLSEDSEEARQCNLHYESCRDAVLRGKDWNFARQRVALADLGNPPDEWDYEYAYPTDCLNAREIINYSDPDDPIAFEVAYNGSVKVIYTNQADAVLRYSARVSDPNLFDATFIEALVLALAVKVVIPLTESQRKLKTLHGRYLGLMGSAEALDAGEGKQKPDRQASWIEARA